jgi:hypothetical protein
MSTTRRLLAALAIAVGIYTVAMGTGFVLYKTEAIGTGPMHTECPDYKPIIAEEQGIDEEDVEQEDIKARAIACHEAEKAEITPEEAFRTEYLYWSIWPAVICAVVFLLWPVWTRILLRQEEHEASEDAPRLEPGT